MSTFPNKIKVIDDTLLWEDTLEQSFFQACQWLELCGKNGIIQNPEKFIFGADTVEFSGFEVSLDNVRPCKKTLQAIMDFPTPKNTTNICSWFGLINQVSYTFSMTDRMQPFRDLLKPKTMFYWDDHLQALFEESKLTIVNEIRNGIQIFDKSKATCLATDWSKNGLGFWLFQKHCQCQNTKPFCCKTGWKVVLVGSRFTHAAESRYAPIEGEALTVAYALDKASHFVLGCENLIVAVDHKPLLGLFGNRSLENIPNNRLRNIKEKTLRYRFTMRHIPGGKNLASDSISRHPTGCQQPNKTHLPDDIASVELHHPTIPAYQIFSTNNDVTQLMDHDMEDGLRLEAIATVDSIAAVTWDAVQEATNSDNDMMTLMEFIESGFPTDSQDLPSAIQVYHQFRDQLSTVDGVVLYKDRIVIPPSLRGIILKALHSAHQGVTSMTARAESSVFWPGITPAIHNTRSRCNHCNRIAPSQPNAPPTPLVYQEYPFQFVCSDFFHYKGHYYLVSVDRYSNWPIVEKVSEGVSSLRCTFVTYGIPDELSSDGGPEFTSAVTTRFLANFEFE